MAMIGHDPNCVQTALLNVTSSVNRVRDYDEDCAICADCFANDDTTPASGNGQGGSYPLGTSKLQGKRKCTDWKYEVTYNYQYTHTCSPCVYYSFGSNTISYIVPDCSPVCEHEGDFTCPDGQYSGGYYDC